jgi:hypothetical protein
MRIKRVMLMVMILLLLVLMLFIMLMLMLILLLLLKQSSEVRLIFRGVASLVRGVALLRRVLCI